LETQTVFDPAQKIEEHRGVGDDKRKSAALASQLPMLQAGKRISPRLVHSTIALPGLCVRPRQRADCSSGLTRVPRRQVIPSMNFKILKTKLFKTGTGAGQTPQQEA